MRYFVIGDDGQKYGPADVPTLQAWIAEGRLLPTQQVEEEGSGVRSAARAIPGLTFPLEAPQQAPQGPGAAQGSPYAQQPGANYQGYPRQGAPYVGDNGSNDLTKAWVFGVLGFFCCFLFGIGGIVYANKAKEKGHPNAQTALIVCSVLLALNIAYTAYKVVAAVNMVQSGKVPGMERSITK